MANLRDSVHKVEANSFTEQSKNKAILDRLSEDIMDVAESVSTLASELKGK